MKINFKKVWKFFNGKKTTIGSIIWLTASGLKAFFPELLTPDQYEFLTIAGQALTGTGLLHKGYKSSHKIYIDKNINNKNIQNGK